MEMSGPGAKDLTEPPLEIFPRAAGRSDSYRVRLVCLTW